MEKPNSLDECLFDGVNKSIPSEEKPVTITDEDYLQKVKESDNGDPNEQINKMIFPTSVNNWNYAISKILEIIKEKGCFEFSISTDKKYTLKLNKEQIKTIKKLIIRYKTIHLKIGNTSSSDKLHFYQTEVTKILHQSRRYDDVGRQKKIRNEIESFLLNPINSCDDSFRAVSYRLMLHFIAEGRFDKMGHEEFLRTQTEMYERYFCHFSPDIINNTIEILKDSGIRYSIMTAIIYLLSNGYVYLDSIVLRKRYSRLK